MSGVDTPTLFEYRNSVEAVACADASGYTRQFPKFSQQQQAPGI